LGRYVLGACLCDERIGGDVAVVLAARLEARVPRYGAWLVRWPRRRPVVRVPRRRSERLVAGLGCDVRKEWLGPTRHFLEPAHRSISHHARCVVGFVALQQRRKQIAQTTLKKGANRLNTMWSLMRNFATCTAAKQKKTTKQKQKRVEMRKFSISGVTITASCGH
jgi:hypothetical protein